MSSVMSLLLLGVTQLHALRIVGARVRALPVACATPHATDITETPFWSKFCEEADAEAEALGLEVTQVSFGGGKLSVSAGGGGVDQLQQLNTYLSGFIDSFDQNDELPPFLLEVSSPGLSPVLHSDADFNAFKGFPVEVTLTEPFKSKTTFQGTLVGRDDEAVSINLKGRLQRIPLGVISQVCLPAAKREAGDIM